MRLCIAQHGDVLRSLANGGAVCYLEVLGFNLQGDTRGCHVVLFAADECKDRCVDRCLCLDTKSDIQSKISVVDFCS